ncbi:dTDP-4-dehydrorhamnose 3,5-epimerase [Bacillus paranthracis]|uniref:dTDP-4-dehydrorhamnose 3,5-epimerase n=1 Tax=Bacillus TaxID=1386 RepID=UPI0022E3B79D|nr:MULTISPECIES: dTDP-4-dehydrorhamnose 3,5-epimerase [Bacillus cereus group]MDA1745339.1 dTDP-4-dehydrorhamnose 3,5-epimerase [Bacillus cereus group sp. LD121LC]MDK7421064.1 dTDP-4-dehydrorhamnose 3,5-epimerase [Bacillus paranthracis]MDK7431657.1 dTDP-4-dehydrorhamnose 3,5-epimerase [Bacillus paranthracis]MDK7517545.1 dTDP-4-dehydrorhamnose 3,5-epimerase [Bacillus paranthracis]MDK7574076.1 dTDP-4-dehydrorhamnose 3,5-epimerase [Bacillus paranthracis]
MKVLDTNLLGVKVIEPKVFGDHRGWFMETYSDKEMKEAGIDLQFVQDNQSFSATKGTLRGLHYQLNPKAQTKLVRCTRGSIFDVAVDIRKGSPTYGQWFGIELSAENKKQLLVPKGFAHGFMTLTNDVEVQYKVDELYAPECDRGIVWNDVEIGVEWPMEIRPVLSEKDEKAPSLKEAENNFVYGE